ncbi:hypothetical protein PQ459_15465 [Chryseobacterium sp. KACC 21268]|nr:hypothetical protein PQ459_15465 [Chryseobacterium sp. KACC 21268]
MTKFQSVNDGKAYEIFPLRGYISILVYLLLFLLIALVPILYFISDDFIIEEVLKLVFYSLLINILIFFPIVLILYHYSYHFSWVEKKIYKKLFFYKKLKMEAENIELDRSNYKIIDKTDRFSNVINLMFFGMKRQNISENTQELIGLIDKNWLSQMPESVEEKALGFNSLVYFKSIDDNEFELIKTNKLHLVLFVVFCLAFLYQLYNLQSKSTSDIGFIDFVTGIPAFVFLIIISTRKIFNLKDRMVYTKFFWVIPYEKMNLDLFHNFEVTKHYTNGFYTGTSLNMLFSKKTNSNKYRHLTIVSATKKTKPFEAMMTEIRFLLSKMK